MKKQQRQSVIDRIILGEYNNAFIALALGVLCVFVGGVMIVSSGIFILQTLHNPPAALVAEWAGTPVTYTVVLEDGTDVMLNNIILKPYNKNSIFAIYVKRHAASYLRDGIYVQRAPGDTILYSPNMIRSITWSYYQK